MAVIKMDFLEDSPDGEVLDSVAKPGAIRVILADSQAIYRVGIRKVFALEDDVRVVAQADSVENLHAAVQRYPTDVVLLEGGMLTGTANAILGMTLDLLDYTQGSVSVNKRPVSIWRLLDELNRQSLHLLPSKNIEFVKHIRYQGNIDIDLGRFARALGHVIENAMHAMPRGGFLTVTTDAVEDKVALRISDTGAGIAPELMPTIFEPFERCGELHICSSPLTADDWPCSCRTSS